MREFRRYPTRECTHCWKKDIRRAVVPLGPCSAGARFMEAADRRLVFRPSTSFEIANVFSGFEDRGCRYLLMLGHLTVDLLEVCFYPPDARDFDFSILRDPK